MNKPMPKQGLMQNALDTDRIGALLIKLAAPAFLGMFVQTLYNAINTVFIGNFIDADPRKGALAIAGLTIVFPIQMLAWGIGMMVGMGGSSLISRCIGSGRTGDAERTIGNGISIAVIMSIGIMIIVIPFLDFWLRLIGASDPVLTYASPYLMIIICGNIFGVLAQSLLNFSRAEGNARVGMIAMIMGATLSIILDAFFIITLKMGVVGAALATVISQIVSMIYLFSYYFSGSSYLKLHLNNLRLDFSILRQMLAIGIGAFVQTIASSLSGVLLFRMVINYGGDVALGAFGIIQRVMMFATMPAMVLAQGVQPILGFNYGAKRYHLALKAIKIAVVASTSLSAIGFIILYLVPGPIIRIFTNDAPTIETGTHVSRLIFLSMPFMGAVMVGQTIFQATGKAVQSFILALSRPVLFLFPSVLIMAHFWQLDGVFLSFPTSDMCTLLLVFGLATPILIQFRKAAAAEKLASSVGPLPPKYIEDSEKTRTMAE